MTTTTQYRTQLPRPHYKPEISTKVAIVNFMITPIGLQDQLLCVLEIEKRLGCGQLPHVLQGILARCTDISFNGLQLLGKAAQRPR